MRLQDKLKEVQSRKKALLACNYYNFETCSGILKAAHNLEQPIILQLTESSIEYMGLKTAVSIGRTLSDSLKVYAWIHLDHARSVELINRCLDAGFDSVMIDASSESFSDNVKTTVKVVKLAEKYDANVEAELGYIPKPGTPADSNKFTDPGEAKKFVDETNVNSLAVAIGTQHGFYEGVPKLDIQRLIRISKSVKACLVLHGGSGIEKRELRKAIKNGITKVNIATETKDIFIRTLKHTLKTSTQIDLRKVFPPAIDAVTKNIENKLLEIR